MKLAMEIPFAHQEELSEHTDFDYALTHLVLEEGPRSRYVKFFRKQARAGRTVWLDNSFHELQRSVSLEDLLQAAKMIQATHIVAPEEREDARCTWYHIKQCKEEIIKKKLPFKTIGCWQGYKKDMFNLLDICDEVALPFDRPRNQFLTRETSGNFHYFGFRSLDELRMLPPKSLDTSMPIRAAMLGIDLRYRERRPKTNLLNFNTTLTKEQLRTTIENINYLKEAGGKDE